MTRFSAKATRFFKFTSMAGLVMVALGCGDGAGLALTDDGGGTSDTRLPDGGSSPKMDAKDSPMPNDATLTTTPTADSGSDSGSDRGRADAQPPMEARPPINVMEIVKRLKFVPARVIFVDIRGNISVTTKNVTLPPGLAPPRDKFMSSTCSRYELGVYVWQSTGSSKAWRYSIPMNGGFFEPSTVLTRAEIEKLGISMDVVGKTSDGRIIYPDAPRFTAMSIDEWLEAQPDVEAALAALKPEAICH